MSATALQNIAQQYAEEIYDWMRPEAQSRALWHQTQGHTLAIVSASLDIYLASVANRLGFNELICSRLEIQNGTVTGKLIGHNCRGAEKVRRLTERFGDLKAFDLYAYGDSDGDKEMLAAAQHPFYRKFS
jgi:HAD superfamily hydrolase (TIGR01490 family)